MIDMEKLREALQTRPIEPWPELDIRQIMIAGRRLRRRRQLRTGVIAGAGLSALLLTGMLVGQPDNRAPTEVAAAPHLAPDPTPTLDIPPSSISRTPRNRQPAPTLVSSKPLGKVVLLKDRKDISQALYMVAIDPDVAGVDHGLVLGRSKNGDFIDQVQIQALDASERTRSFQAFHQATSGDQLEPSFGYYTGPAKVIYATSRLNKMVAAQQVQWSKDPDTVIFWFSSEDLASVLDLTSLTAQNSDGTRVTVKWSDLGTARK